MPRIPDKEILGDRPALPVDRSIQSPQYATAPLQAGIEGLSRIGAAAGRVGQAIENRAVAFQQAGEKLNEWGIKQKEKIDDEALINAKMQWLQDNIAIDSSFNEDTDYQNYTTKYKKATGEAMNKSMAILNGVDPDVRNKFLQTLQMDVMRGTAAIEKKQLDGWRDARTANSNKIIGDALLEASKLPPGDPRADEYHNVALAAANNQFDGVAGSQSERQKKVDKVNEEYSKSRLMTLEPKDRLIELEKSMNRPTSEEDIIRSVMKYEGNADAVAKDNKGNVRYGINSVANQDVNLEKLSEEGAYGIYKTRYWDALNIGSLPENMRYIVFDAAVNQGQGAARDMLAKSGNDPIKFAELRKERYASGDPSLQKGWTGRVNRALAMSGAISVYHGDNIKTPGEFQSLYEKTKTQYASQAKQAISYIESELSNISKGDMPTPTAIEAINSSGLYFGNDFPEVAARVSHFNSMTDFASKFSKQSPVQMEAVINNVLAPMALKNGSTEEEQYTLDMAKSILKNTNEQIENDTVGFAASKGIIDAPIPLDPNDPNTFVKRSEQMRTVESLYGAGKVKYTTPEERSAAKEFFSDPNKTPQDVTNYLSSMLNRINSPSDRWRLINELTEGDKNLAYAAGMMLADGKFTDTATAIVNGKRINDNLKAKPSTEFTQAMKDEIGGADSRMVEQGEFRSAVMNMYASLGGDISDSVTNIDILKQAVARVSGGMGRTEDDSGIVSINGKKVWLPINVNKDEFNETLSRMDTEDYVAISDSKGYMYDVSGNKISADDIRSYGSFVAVGKNKYKIQLRDGFVSTSNGSDYTVTINEDFVNNMALRIMDTQPSAGSFTFKDLYQRTGGGL